MIIGVGTDLIEISRIQESVERFGEQFLEKIFTPSEIEYSILKANKYQHLAVRFAAKEAVFKCFPKEYQTLISWQNIEVHTSENGQPEIQFHGLEKLDELKKWILHISMTHTHNYASCIAVLSTPDLL